MEARGSTILVGVDPRVQASGCGRLMRLRSLAVPPIPSVRARLKKACVRTHAFLCHTFTLSLTTIL